MNNNTARVASTPATQQVHQCAVEYSQEKVNFTVNF